MRDQLYPVKIDNANRAAVLNPDGTIRQEAAAVLGVALFLWQPARCVSIPRPAAHLLLALSTGWLRVSAVLFLPWSAVALLLLLAAAGPLRFRYAVVAGEKMFLIARLLAPCYFR